MPQGDMTGPAGRGPKTGRKAGYCVGNDTPGCQNPPSNTCPYCGKQLENGVDTCPTCCDKTARPGRGRGGPGHGMGRGKILSQSKLNDTERHIVEAIGNLFRNDEDALGITSHKPKEVAHGFEFQWNGIEDMFALKTAKSLFHEELTGAFRDIHSYKYLDDPTFCIALEKRLTARGIPTEEIVNAKKYCSEIKEQLQKMNFQEKDAGWHPDLDEVLDTTRNANTRTPKQEAPYTGGGPAPSRNEIG